MSEPRTRVLLRCSPLTDPPTYYAITRYRMKDGVVVVSPNGKRDVTADMEFYRAEAVADAMAALRAEVEALPVIVEFLPPAVRRSMVLALIDKAARR
jgi:hypothetical protein